MQEWNQKRGLFKILFGNILKELSFIPKKCRNGNKKHLLRSKINFSCFSKFTLKGIHVAESCSDNQKCVLNILLDLEKQNLAG